jgi:ABC-type transporter MlaC component
VEREEIFRRFLLDGFAMEKIGRFVVGLYWKQMSPDQRRDYQKLFSAATQREWEGTPVKNSLWIKRKRPSKKTFSCAREL